MRKRVVGSTGSDAGAESTRGYLDLEQIATVEVTSESPDFPIESVFDLKANAGWRALQPGEQCIRLIFDEPVSLKRIYLVFRDSESERTQEIAIRWSSSTGGASKEILRQRWNFSPSGSTTEIEDLTVDLPSLLMLELSIQPDVSGSSTLASLASWFLS